MKRQFLLQNGGVGGGEGILSISVLNSNKSFVHPISTNITVFVFNIRKIYNSIFKKLRSINLILSIASRSLDLIGQERLKLLHFSRGSYDVGPLEGGSALKAVQTLSLNTESKL